MSSASPSSAPAPVAPVASPSFHRTEAELLAELAHVLAAPSAAGVLELIVSRPAENERVVCAAGELSPAVGLVGDNWSTEGPRMMTCQLTLMSARAAQLVAVTKDRWPLAGDQLYVDFDLSEVNLPAGSRLAIGETAVVEVTAEPHTGCTKFIERYGLAAMKFVNSPRGRALNLRGINTTVLAGGVIRVGDAVRKVG